MLALDKKATITTFGDLIRVPGPEMRLSAGARSKECKCCILLAARLARSMPRSIQMSRSWLLRLI